MAAGLEARFRGGHGEVFQVPHARGIAPLTAGGVHGFNLYAAESLATQLKIIDDDVERRNSRSLLVQQLLYVVGIALG